MSTTSHPRLTLDDPLSGAQRERSAETLPRPTSPQRPPTSIAKTPHKHESAAEVPAVIPAPSEGEDWRDWSGRNRVASFRFPDELLDELAKATARLGLPIGQTVIAGITSLLDHDDGVITAQVDRVAQAITRGKRRARRRPSAEGSAE